jgi:hypothetical protein
MRLRSDTAILGFSSTNTEGYFTYLVISKIAYCYEPPSGATRREARKL